MAILESFALSREPENSQQSVIVNLSYQPDCIWNQLRRTVLGKSVSVFSGYINWWGRTSHNVGSTFLWPSRYKEVLGGKFCFLPAYTFAPPQWKHLPCCYRCHSSSYFTLESSFFSFQMCTEDQPLFRNLSGLQHQIGTAEVSSLTKQLPSPQPLQHADSWTTQPVSWKPM